MVKFPPTENNYFTVSVSVEEKTEQIDNIPNFFKNISYFLLFRGLKFNSDPEL